MGKKKPPQVKVRFGTPPEPRRDYHWDEVAEQLRSRPGEWAVVHEDLPSSVQWSVSRGRVAAVAPALGFQSRTAGNVRDESGKQWCAELWMMYDPSLDQSRAKQNGGKR